MIAHGIKLEFTDHNDLSLIPSFGGTDNTSGLPAQYIVATSEMPDQDADGLYEACTAYAQTELAADQTGEEYDIKEFYLSTPPGDLGPRAMRDSLSLLTKRGPKTTKGVLKSWDGKYYNIYKYGKLDWYNAFKVGLYIVRNEKRAASAAMPWYREWSGSNVPASGIVPDLGTYSWTNASGHDAVIGGWTSVSLINGKPLGDEYMAIKSWQGQVGDGGWLYFSKAIINKVFELYYTEVFTVSQQKPTTFATVDLPAIERIISFIKNLFNLK